MQDAQVENAAPLSDFGETWRVPFNNGADRVTKSHEILSSMVSYTCHPEKSVLPRDP